MNPNNNKDITRSKTIPLLPLRDIVVFPNMIIPLFIGRIKSVKAVENALSHGRNIFLSTQKNPKTNNPEPSDIFEIGTIGEILQILKLADGTVKVLVEGKERGKIGSFLNNKDFFEVNVIRIEEKVTTISIDIKALMKNINSLFEEYVKLNQRITPEVLISITNTEDPYLYADTISAHLNLKIFERQQILELVDIKKRLNKIYNFIESDLAMLRIEKKVRGRVKKQMEKSQKEYYLTEQMKAIQKELGRYDDIKTEINELKNKIKKAKMPKDINEKALKELKRLEMMPPMSAEATVVRNYIDWLVELPWEERTKDKLRIIEAERILNEDHYGLEKIKERIVEYLSVRKLVKKMKGPILCLVGPPGVGKTSLGQSIARALGRRFVRMSLGGVRDEAEIRGHRRTYIGALPGRIIQCIKNGGTKNPVFMLDEIDKMSTDFRGDPSAALLEVLDPEQNNAFDDHYLEVRFDLSEVMFITTANVLYSIPQPLQDRMEILRIPGYTEHEKLRIAELFLIPKKLSEHGLIKKNLCFSRAAIQTIIKEYTREAGVRGLEREIASICRKVAKKVVSEGRKTKVNIIPRKVANYLGPSRYRVGKAEKKKEIGLATGLAWTEVGGELLTIEVIVMDGKGKLTLTGKLGDVMQESAHAALSYVRSRASQLGLKRDFYQKKDIHIHIPEGAIPKDGPSAGITIAAAIISGLTNIPVRNDVAMTGEITLRGRVLPVGGVKEKILAAHRGEIRTIILPNENEKDMKDIPATIRKSLKIIFVENMDEVIKIVMVKGEERKISETSISKDKDIEDKFEIEPAFDKSISELPSVN